MHKTVAQIFKTYKKVMRIFSLNVADQEYLACQSFFKQILPMMPKYRRAAGFIKVKIHLSVERFLHDIY